MLTAYMAHEREAIESGASHTDASATDRMGG